MEPRSFMIITFFLSMSLLIIVAEQRLHERRRVYRTLQVARPSEVRAEDLHRRGLAQPASRRLVVPGFRRLGKLARKLTPVTVLENLGRKLTYAGSPAGWDAERLMATKLLTGGLSGVVWALIGPASWKVLLVFSLTYLGYKSPDLILRSKYQKRQEALRTALPDTLDLLSITVEAGLGFDQALQRVSDQVGGPLGQEFNRVIAEIQLGKGRSEALRSLSDRTTIQEVKSFVVSMIQADTFGVSIAGVLKVQARELRTRRRQNAEERAQKIPVKIVFPLLFCIFPALFVIILGPAAIRIYEALIR